MINNQIIFTVTGMHRSGSSMFAHWLQTCGIYIGDELLGRASSNPNGHFEDMEFLNLHVRELRKNGLDGSGLYGKLHNIVLSKDFEETAKEIIFKRNLRTIWGWKEPRTTLFLNEWKRIIPDLKVIILVREKDKVVNSLYRRLSKGKWYVTRNPLKRLYWKFDIDFQKSKWIKRFGKVYDFYDMKSLEYANANVDHTLFIHLSDFIENHEIEVRRINEFLGIHLPVDKLSHVYTKDYLH